MFSLPNLARLQVLELHFGVCTREGLGEIHDILHDYLGRLGDTQVRQLRLVMHVKGGVTSRAPYSHMRRVLGIRHSRIPDLMHALLRDYCVRDLACIYRGVPFTEDDLDEWLRGRY